MDAPYSARTIAKWFIAWAEAEEADLSNLKLQKLLYYAQGHYVALHRKPLFKEDIQAWSHGPVVPAVYHEWKGYGSADLHLEPADPFNWADVSGEDSQFLGQVWNSYGWYAAWHLRNMTHDEPPWQKNWRGDQFRGIVISVPDLEEHFTPLTKK
ncbi:Panacea domain-containing protein [Amycolatopsis jejuensis]|uniref:Panacea domain-containing protein n=1 Tax=Amycolatopsis jejuensis TaxID=330084 RepID=UPI000526CE90|nr:type II toxin-antitoxin system antitoxin SocA domain-containing protein [Amycolatopsis jejuensis]